MAKIDLLKRLAARYRRAYPQLKFSVKRVKLDMDFSLTGHRTEDGAFIIEIDKHERPTVACFILAHEIAHAISWHLCPPEEPHAKPFWDAYERTYMIYEKFCDEVNK